MTLTEFLLARIAEDEAAARSALTDFTERYDGVVEVDAGSWATGSADAYDAPVVCGTGIKIYDEGGHTHEQAVHIARHDPARVLAESEAKRQIVEGAWAEIGLSTAEDWLFPLLALPYADHPDYREEWKP